MLIEITILLISIDFINLIILEWASGTSIERSCNYAKNDFSYFGISSYTDNSFVIVNLNYNDNLEGNVNVYLIDNHGKKVKKKMLCKLWSSSTLSQKNLPNIPTFAILFCDLFNDNNFYPGIQLLNDGEIQFSGNYDKGVKKCNSYNYNNEEDKNELTDKPTNIKETNDDNKETDNGKNLNDNDNNNNNESHDNNDDNSEKNENNADINENKNDNNDKNIKEVEEDKKEIKNVKISNKKYWGVSKNTAIGICAGSLSVAGIGIGATIFLRHLLSSRSKGSSSNYKSASSEKNNIKGEYNKLIKAYKPKKTWIYYLLIWVPFSICGMTWLIPILKGRFEDIRTEDFVPDTTNIFYNQEYYDSIYRQKQSDNSNDHINHICEDPRKTPRKNPIYFGCPNKTTGKTLCWYCKFGCALGSVLNILGKTQKEINLDDYLNEDADLNWTKLKEKNIISFADSNEPQDNCIGKIKKKKNRGISFYSH